MSREMIADSSIVQFREHERTDAHTCLIYDVRRWTKGSVGHKASRRVITDEDKFQDSRLGMMHPVIGDAVISYDSVPLPGAQTSNDVDSAVRQRVKIEFDSHLEEMVENDERAVKEIKVEIKEEIIEEVKEEKQVLFSLRNDFPTARDDESVIAVKYVLNNISKYVLYAPRALRKMQDCIQEAADCRQALERSHDRTLHHEKNGGREEGDRSDNPPYPHLPAESHASRQEMPQAGSGHWGRAEREGYNTPNYPHPRCWASKQRGSEEGEGCNTPNYPHPPTVRMHCVSGHRVREEGEVGSDPNTPHREGSVNITPTRDEYKRTHQASEGEVELVSGQEIKSQGSAE